ncbi:MAG: DUF4124 domain-containing protein [Gammaproteobacteria bacterium]
MNKYACISLYPIVFLLVALLMPVHADSVHKWIDAQGITHYSDQLPVNNSSIAKPIEATRVDVSSTYHNSSKQNEYYSVTNQWARMREERIARKQLQLEKAKLKAAQRPVVPQVVYVNEIEEDQSRAVYYPTNLTSFRHRGYRHGQQNYRHNAGNKHFGSYSGASCNLPRKGHKRSGSTGLTLTFR